jgi:hypothetical protein
MIQDLTLMWICAWRIMWTQRTAVIWTAMWIWQGMATMMRSKMKRTKMKRRKMRRRIRMTMMAKNL